VCSTTRVLHLYRSGTDYVGKPRERKKRETVWDDVSCRRRRRKGVILYIIYIIYILYIIYVCIREVCLDWIAPRRSTKSGWRLVGNLPYSRIIIVVMKKKDTELIGISAGYYIFHSHWLSELGCVPLGARNVSIICSCLTFGEQWWNGSESVINLSQ